MGSVRRTNVAVERSGIVTFWDAMPPVANLFVTAIVIVGDGSVQELRMASVLMGMSIANENPTRHLRTPSRLTSARLDSYGRDEA